METICGYLKKIVYESEKGFMICKFQLEKERERFIFIKGFLGMMKADELYELQGTFIKNDRYGESFDVKTVKHVAPSGEEQLVKYFSSRLFPTIGPKAAQAIVDYFKTDVIKSIQQDYKRLANIKELSVAQCEIIERTLCQANETTQLNNFFAENGLNQNVLVTLQTKFNQAEIKVILTNDPYRLIDNDQIKFKEIDAIFVAFNPGRELDPIRIAYYALHLTRDYCFQNGHTYLDLDTINRLLTKQIINLSHEQVLAGLMHAKSQQLLKFEQQRIYDYEIYNSEINIAYFLRNVNQATGISEEEARQMILKIAENKQIFYNADQSQALLHMITNDLTIVTGGPGTGKTTIVEGMIACLHKLGYRREEIILTAPTGKAAKRLTEKTHQRASTIHKLLKWDPNKNDFQVNRENPLDAKVLIIDEMSMVDTLLFGAIANASQLLTKVVVIGDRHQLPSVNCGNVLADIIASDAFPIINLQEIHRQKAGNDILDLSYSIMNGELHQSALSTQGDVTYLSALNEAEINNALHKLLDESLSNLNIDDWQVIAPMYNGIGGINALNRFLQDEVNPMEIASKTVKVGLATMRINDKVMQLKNRPELEIYNGDVGIIIDIKTDTDFKKHIVVDFDGNVVTYSKEMYYDLTLAYACSVHKMQGSEYDTIIFVFTKSCSFMMQRQIIYTAITRAKTHLYLIGDADTLRRGVSRLVNERLTTLRLRLNDTFGKNN